MALPGFLDRGRNVGFRMFAPPRHHRCDDDDPAGGPGGRDGIVERFVHAGGAEFIVSDEDLRSALLVQVDCQLPGAGLEGVVPVGPRPLTDFSVERVVAIDQGGKGFACALYLPPEFKELGELVFREIIGGGAVHGEENDAGHYFSFLIIDIRADYFKMTKLVLVQCPNTTAML